MLGTHFLGDQTLHMQVPYCFQVEVTSELRPILWSRPWMVLLFWSFTAVSLRTDSMENNAKFTVIPRYHGFLIHRPFRGIAVRA